MSKKKKKFWCKKYPHLRHFQKVKLSSSQFSGICALGQTPVIRVENNITFLVFLLANIFTGLVNLTIDTRSQGSLVAHGVMMVYLISMTIVSFGVYKNESVRRIVTGHIVKRDLKMHAQ